MLVKVMHLKYMGHEIDFNSCATCRQIVLIICLRKREIMQMEIKGLPESVEIPKAARKRRGRGVRDRVTNIGEKMREEMGLSDF